MSFHPSHDGVCHAYAADDMIEERPAGALPAPETDNLGNFRWYVRGAIASLSLPAFILAASFVGFAALAVEAGITITQAVFMTAVVWALPSKVRPGRRHHGRQTG